MPSPKPEQDEMSQAEFVALVNYIKDQRPSGVTPPEWAAQISAAIGDDVLGRSRDEIAQALIDWFKTYLKAGA